jgi:DNA-binding transcriptional LysR family regulator
MTGDLDEWLQTGKLDVALLSNQKDFHNITWTEMMTEDLSVIARSDAPIAHRKCIEFEELPHHAIVLPSESHVIRIAVQACAARKGIKFDVAAECDSLMGIIQLVRGGYFTIGPRFAMAEEIERCELVAIPLVRPTPKWILSVATSKRTINSRASQAIAAVLADEIRSMVQAGSWPARLRKQAGERVVSV